MRSARGSAALRRVVTVALPAAAITALVVVLLVTIQPRLGPALSFAVVRAVDGMFAKPPSISDAFMKEASGLLGSRSIEYRHEFVFPYDFFPNASADWRAVDRLDALQRSGEALSAEQEEYLQAAGLAREIGISPDSLPPRYLVVTVVAHAGFPAVFQSDRPWITAHGWTALVSLPDPAVTRTNILESEPTSADETGLSLSEDQWKKVVLFVSEHAGARILRAGILVDARDQGEAIIRSLLNTAGFTAVRFLPAGG